MTTPPDRKSTRWIFWACGSALFLVFSCCSGCFGYVNFYGWTPWKVEYLVHKACPIGTSRADVQRWLESNPFSDQSSDYWGTASPTGCYVNEVNLDPRFLSDCLWIEVANPNMAPFGGEIEVDFYFDKEDKLLLAYVRVWEKGL
jgi:hypothetical protein